MNERIQELVGQGKFMAEETVNKQISANAELNTFAEKFAELIVRAVFDKIEEERFEIYQPVKESVMKHFGVKE